MKINQSRWVVSGILGWWMYKCSIILRGFVIPNRPFGGQIRWLELQMLSEMTRLTSCCSWSSCNSATTDSFLGEKYVRVKENTENPACLGPSIFLDAIAYLAFFFYHALFMGSKHIHNSRRGTSASEFWYSKMMLHVFLQTSRLSGGLPTCVAPMIEGFIGCPHSNSKVSSTWDKLAVESLEFCQGRALAVFPNPYIYIYI